MEEAWTPTSRIRAICLYPLRLDASGNVPDDLLTYLDGVQALVNAMLKKGHSWHMIEEVDMVIITVKLAGAWALFMTPQRSQNHLADGLPFELLRSVVPVRLHLP